MAEFKSLLGKRLGLDKYGALAAIAGIFGQKRVTDPIAHAAITISAEGATVANQRDITIQLYDCNGKAINYAAVFELVLFSSSAMTDFVATGGTTGIAAGASGKIQAIIAKKLFRAISTTAGLLTCIYTDTGTDAGYLAVRLPNGQIIGGGLITNT